MYSIFKMLPQLSAFYSIYVDIYVICGTIALFYKLVSQKVQWGGNTMFQASGH